MARKGAVLGLIVLAAAAQAWGADKEGLPRQENLTRLHATWEGHTGAVQALAFNPLDPARLASGGSDKTERDKSILRFWDVTSGKCITVDEKMPGDIICLDWSQDGRFLLVGTDNYYDRYVGMLRTAPRVIVYDPSRGRSIKEVALGQYSEPYALKFSPDGQSILIAGSEKNIHVYGGGEDPAKIMLKRLLMGHDGQVRAVTWSADGTRVASSGVDTTIRIWDPSKLTQQLEKAMTGHTHAVNAIAWSRDGSFLATASSDKTVRTWDVAAACCTRTLEGHTEPVTGVAITPDGRHIVSVSSDSCVRIWEVVSGKCVQTLKEHVGPIEVLATSADGKLFATGGPDKKVRIWVMGTYK